MKREFRYILHCVNEREMRLTLEQLTIVKLGGSCSPELTVLCFFRVSWCEFITYIHVYIHNKYAPALLARVPFH